MKNILSLSLIVSISITTWALPNNDCAHFCATNFPSNPGKLCTSPAAHGTGPCYTCGPSAPLGHPDVCNGACCTTASSTCCGGSTCVNTQTDVQNCGTCGHACGTGESCISGVCVAPSCTGQTCGTFVPGCNDNNNCYCWKTTEGSGFCTSNFLCGDHPTCNSSSDCPSGSKCTQETCCGDNRCSPTICTIDSGPFGRRALIGRAVSGLTASGN